MEFTKVTTDPDFSISGVVLGGAMAIVSFRWVNRGEFVSEGWSSVNVARMRGWASEREQQSMAVSNLVHPAGVFECASAAGEDIAWRTNARVTVLAGTWHEAQLVFPVRRS